MKKIGLILFLMFLVCTFKSQAQDQAQAQSRPVNYVLGVKAGLNVSNLNASDGNGQQKLGLNLGATID